MPDPNARAWPAPGMPWPCRTARAQRAPAGPPSIFFSPGWLAGGLGDPDPRDPGRARPVRRRARRSRSSGSRPEPSPAYPRAPRWSPGWAAGGRCARASRSARALRCWHRARRDSPALAAALAGHGAARQRRGRRVNAQGVELERRARRPLSPGCTPATRSASSPAASAGTAAAAAGVPCGALRGRRPRSGSSVRCAATGALVDGARGARAAFRAARAAASLLLGLLGLLRLPARRRGVQLERRAPAHRAPRRRARRPRGAFTAFPLALAFGRLLGDRLVARAGASRVVQAVRRRGRGGAAPSPSPAPSAGLGPRRLGAVRPRTGRARADGARRRPAAADSPPAGGHRRRHHDRVSRLLHGPPAIGALAEARAASRPRCGRSSRQPRCWSCSPGRALDRECDQGRRGCCTGS